MLRDIVSKDFQQLRWLPSHRR